MNKHLPLWLALATLVLPEAGMATPKTQDLPSLQEGTQEVLVAKRRKRKRRSKRKKMREESDTESYSRRGGHDFYPSLLLGVTYPSLSGLSAAFGFGLDGIYKIQDDFTVGGFVLYSTQEIGSASSSVGSATANFSFLPIGVMGGLFLGEHFNLSGALGMVIQTGSATVTVGSASATVSASSTDLFIGAKAGYYYPITNEIHVLMDVKPLFVFAGTSYLLLNAMVGMSYAF